MITDVEGVRVGHWTDESARTGCTVVLFPEGTVGSGEIRGGAPATRDFAVLEPSALVQQLDAVVLSGGSTFGLAAVDGVLSWCESEGRGIETPAACVPIVVGLSLYDLSVGDASVRPRADHGRQAIEGASADAPQSGRIGAGCGATVGKWRGRERARRSGLVTAAERDGGLVVAALVAVNAWGDPLGATPPDVGAPIHAPFATTPAESTTIGVVATNARLTKTQCMQVARAAHAGLARSLFPVHSPFDGDALVVGATGGHEAPIEAVVPLADRVVAAAVASLVVGEPGDLD
ncbi:MAG TPA: P1 family peptidase [Microthrixaceae bacterium]|nr:P1 family peptidase [Microthrixaceae bacterium]